ncbi:MAG: cation efflux protein, CzcI family [Janthinobacterium lividum]
MKKFLLIFLLIVLPVQYSWAAAVAYCTHEKEQSTHFGHHVHQHQGQKSDDNGSNKLVKVHSDCSVCQFAAHAPLTSFTPDIAIPVLVTHWATNIVRFTSHIPDTPPVPDWRLVA